ncbi:MAG: glycosyltransferase, partial [Bacteroidetes bacterium]
IADAARRLLNDPAHYHRLVENCRRAARELCWENEKFRLLEIWELLLE